MPQIEFDPARRKLLGKLIAAGGLLAIGRGVIDMNIPLDDPQKKSVSPLTTTQDGFSKMLELSDNCRRNVVDSNSQECLTVEQAIGHELEAQVAYRGRLRKEQLNHDTVLSFVGAIIGLIGLKMAD